MAKQGEKELISSTAEQQRIDHLVMGKPRPAPTARVVKQRGRRKSVEWVPAALASDVDRALKVREQFHLGEATPETVWHHERHRHEGALVQLYRNGVVDEHQLTWASQIADAAESIERDVGVKIANYGDRVDYSTSSDMVGASIGRVRLHMAYGRWRSMLPMPKRLVLDMLVGESIGFTVAARRHGVHNRKAKRLLIEAIDRWPDCMDWAVKYVSGDALDLVAERIGK